MPGSLLECQSMFSVSVLMSLHLLPIHWPAAFDIWCICREISRVNQADVDTHKYHFSPTRKQSSASGLLQHPHTYG